MDLLIIDQILARFIKDETFPKTIILPDGEQERVSGKRSRFFL